MSASASAVDSSGGQTTFDVTATADADSSVEITHGISGVDAADTQLKVTLEPIRPEFYLSNWYVSARSATTITLTKDTQTGSGHASAQARVHIERVHTINE